MDNSNYPSGEYLLIQTSAAHVTTIDPLWLVDNRFRFLRSPQCL
jgi:hypothetical protein